MCDASSRRGRGLSPSWGSWHRTPNSSSICNGREGFAPSRLGRENPATHPSCSPAIVGPGRPRRVTSPIPPSGAGGMLVAPAPPFNRRRVVGDHRQRHVFQPPRMALASGRGGHVGANHGSRFDTCVPGGYDFRGFVRGVAAPDGHYVPHGNDLPGAPPVGEAPVARSAGGS
jgi:hypothetical protein